MKLMKINKIKVLLGKKLLTNRTLRLLKGEA
jgi:hypothetical protein